MTDPVPDELRALRERAYGRSADIHEDPEALRRLEELEAAQSPSPHERMDAEPAPIRPGSPSPSAPESPGTVKPEGPGEPGDDAVPGGSTGLSPRLSPRLRRRAPALWIASILVAFGIGAAATSIWAVTAFAPITRGPAYPHQVAVLPEAPDPAPSGTLGLSDLRSFGDFYGLSVLTPSPGAIGPPGARCLIVMKTADYQDSASDVRGPVNFSCGAGRFPATVVMSVEADAPSALRAAFPRGTGLQFVLDGSRVGVFTDR